MKLKKILSIILVCTMSLSVGCTKYSQKTGVLITNKNSNIISSLPKKTYQKIQINKTSNNESEVNQDEIPENEKLEIEQKLYSKNDVKEKNLEEELYYDSLELLAICVMAEAGNQDLDGMRMVCDVILNRVDDPDFPERLKR